MNQNIMSQLPNGKIYNTVYPAAANQDSSAGTADIINHIQTTLQSSPNECFILEGYSQGAAATVNALVQLSGAANTAVKGVFLIGDPLHKAGLACNVDSNGGTTTRDLNGISEYYGSNSIPSGFVSRSLDVCDPVRVIFSSSCWRNVIANSGSRAMVFAPTMVKASMLNIFPTLMMLMCRTWAPSLLLTSLLALPTLTSEDFMYITSRLSIRAVLEIIQTLSTASSVVINPYVSKWQLIDWYLALRRYKLDLTNDFEINLDNLVADALLSSYLPSH
jgi:hypothetical protein